MKKGILKKAAAAALSVSLLLGTCMETYAVFPEVLLHQAGTKLSNGTSLFSNTYWKESVADKVSENYITYSPNSAVKPVVVYGSKVCNYGNFNDMAALLEKRGYNVIGGINGDYYNMDTCQPLGMIITDGKLKTSDDGHFAVGFKDDGTAIFGSPALNMNITVDNNTYALCGINKERTDNGLYLFTEDFSYTTKSTGGGTDVVLGIVSGDLTVNSQVTLKVESVSHVDGAANLPAGKMLLSLSDNASGQEILKQFTVGKTVTLKVSCADTRWNSVQFAIGSLYKLITAGKIESGLDDSTAGPRTAIGMKANGELILYTVDGRQPGFSMGATINDVAERLLKMGCVEATLMDGGGSTTLGAKYIGSSSYSLINSPSGGQMRNVSTFIMLAAKGSGEAANMGIYPYDTLMLPGTQRTFTAGKSDNYGNPKSVGTVSWQIKSGTGTITNSGIFKASGTGTSVISASSDGLSASTTVRVVNPDTINILNESTGDTVKSLTLEAGQTVSLAAEAIYNRMHIDTQDSDFYWKLSGDIGNIDATGTFTAGLSWGTGTLTVAAGAVQTSIPVTVEVGITKLEDFEGSSLNLSGTPKNATAAITGDMDHVRFGRQSADIKYDLKNGNAFVPLSFNLSSATPYISVWVYGDSSGNNLQFLTSAGATESVALDFTGWKQLVLAANSGITGIQISGKGSGEIWLDQITAESVPAKDTTPPVISTPVINNTLLSAGVWDDYDCSINYYNMSVYCDGKALQYDYIDGQLQSYLPALDPSVSHRITIYASDISGNRARLSIDIPAKSASQAVFSDLRGHWSEAYVNYLYNMHIVNGISENNVLSYQPNSAMTREQFSVVMAKYLGLDLSKYEGTKLDFADTSKIQPYALPSVKAMYALGIIKGVSDGKELYFNPSDSLTRAQAMTIIGRITPAGYALSEMTFKDAADIPSWAKNHVNSLVSQGIVGGDSDGQLLPNSSVTRGEIAKIITMLY